MRWFCVALVLATGCSGVVVGGVEPEPDAARCVGIACERFDGGGADAREASMSTTADADVEEPDATDAAPEAAKVCPGEVFGGQSKEITDCLPQATNCPGDCPTYSYGCLTAGVPRGVAGCVRVGGGACCAQHACTRYLLGDSQCPSERPHTYYCPLNSGIAPNAANCEMLKLGTGPNPTSYCCSTP